MDSIGVPQMRRRAFLAITAGGRLAAPLAAEGQRVGPNQQAWRGILARGRADNSALRGGSCRLV